MFDSSVADVAIGLIFTYLVLGLVCTTVNEWVAQFFGLRAATLNQALQRLLDEAPSLNINAANLLAKLKSTRLAAALGVDAAQIEARLANGDNSVIQELMDKLSQAVRDPKLFEKIDAPKVVSEILTKVGKIAPEVLTAANYKLLSDAYPEAIAYLPTLASRFRDHPLIQSLSKADEQPSYIPARTFSSVLADILGRDGVNPELTLSSIEASIDALPDSNVKRSLEVMLQHSGGDLTAFRAQIETWFNNAMDRASGWYKQRLQWITVALAAAVTIFANADTIQIARSLYLNPALRAKLVQDASAAKASSDSHILTPTEKADLGELTGWSSEFRTFHQLQASADHQPVPANNDRFPGLDLVRRPGILLYWLWSVAPTHLLGWLLTAIAASLGAPFWFDTLNKFMNVRSAGTAPEEKGKDLSKV